MWDERHKKKVTYFIQGTLYSQREVANVYRIIWEMGNSKGIM